MPLAEFVLAAAPVILAEADEELPVTVLPGALTLDTGTDMDGDPEAGGEETGGLDGAEELGGRTGEDVELELVLAFEPAVGGGGLAVDGSTSAPLPHGMG